MIRIFCFFFLFSNFLHIYSDVSIDAGNIIAEINQFGSISKMVWPKTSSSTDKERIYWIENGIAYERDASYRNFSVNDSDAFSGFYEDTDKADQEFRTIGGMVIGSGDPIRVRQSTRAFKSTSRMDEIEIAYEYTNGTGRDIDEFYYGSTFNLRLPFEFFSTFDPVTQTTTFNNYSIFYDKNKQMFWLGSDSAKYYVAVLMTLGDVHTAKIVQSSIFYEASYSEFAEGTVPESNIDLSNGDSFFFNVSIFFSTLHKGLVANERVYTKFVVAFAETEAELTGSITRLQASASGVQEEASAPSINGTPAVPAPVNSGGGGGCLIKTN